MHQNFQKNVASASSQRSPSAWLALYENAGIDFDSELRLLYHSDRSLLSHVDHARSSAVFDGILYNRADLSTYLANSEPIPNDAELILRAYHRWGEDFLHQIKGIFSFILRDGERDVLIGARDPIGVFPLFYAHTVQEWFFSTSIEALIKHSQVSQKINRAALADHLCHRWPNIEETFFQNVQRVPPGHLIQINASNQKTVRRYWDLPIPGIGCDWIQEDELELFDQLLDQAVDRCLSLGKTAIYLSGGLDSVSVAAVAAKNCQHRGLQPPWALSLAFPGECNEAEVQKAVAAQLGLPQVLLPFEQAVGADGLLLSVLEQNRNLPFPSLNPWEPAYHQLALAGKQQGCKVILTGNGGDEWLGVTPLLAADLIRHLNLKDLYYLWNSLLRSFSIPWYTMAHSILWRFGIRPVLGEVKRTTVRRLAYAVMPDQLRARRQNAFWKSHPDWIMPDPLLRQEVEQRYEQSWERSWQEQATHSFYFREVRAAFNHPLTVMEMEEIFESGNRLEMRILMPYWDTDLLTMLYRTPPRLLLKGGRSKGLVRESMARQFPHLGFERQKKVISLDFFNSTLFNEGRKAWQALGGTPALVTLGIVDEERLKPAMEGFLYSNRYQQIQRIWEILSLESWLQSRI